MRMSCKNEDFCAFKELPEIWFQVLQSLSRNTLKQIASVSSCLYGIARELIWYEPKLALYQGRPMLLSAEDLKSLAKWKVPIRNLKLSQIAFSSFSIYSDVFNESSLPSADDICRVVEEITHILLDDFNLTSLFLDDCTFDYSGGIGTDELLNILLFTPARSDSALHKNLPIKRIDTRCLLLGGVDADPEDCVDVLVKAHQSICSCCDSQHSDRCPEIIVGYDFYRYSQDSVTDTFWGKLSRLKLIRLSAIFNDDTSQPFDFDQFNSAMKHMNPAPAISIIEQLNTIPLAPECFESIGDVQISELWLGVIDDNIVREQGVEPYIKALNGTNQQPCLIFPNRYSDVCFSLKDVEMLFQYPVKTVHTYPMDITDDNAGLFTELFVSKHRQEPFEHFYISRFNRCAFKSAHKEQLRDAGIIERFKYL